jgi:hypothetical protein
MAGGCSGRVTKVESKIWKEKAKDRGIWSDLAGKAKTQKGL